MQSQKKACNSRSIVAEGSQGITGVTGTHADLVWQSIVCWEELLSDVSAVCILPIVASSKEKQACMTGKQMRTQPDAYVPSKICNALT